MLILQAWQQVVFEGFFEIYPQLFLQLFYALNVSGVGISQLQVFSLVSSTYGSLKVLTLGCRQIVKRNQRKENLVNIINVGSYASKLKGIARSKIQVTPCISAED